MSFFFVCSIEYAFAEDVPTDTDGEGAISPVAALDQWHFTVQIGTGTVEDLVGVTVTTEVIVGVANALIMGVRMRHFVGGVL